MPSDLLPIILSSPGAIALNIGPLSIRWYGIFIGIAFLVAYYFIEKLVIKNELNLNHFSNLIFLVLVFGILFARLYFVFLSWDYFKDHLGEIVQIQNGGQSIHGGIFGGVLAGLVYVKVNKISFFKYADVFAVSLPLGQAIGRWGNFFNNEAFGVPAINSFIKLYVPLEFRPEIFLENQYFHPTFLYESLLNFIIFIYIYKQYPRWKQNPGRTFWVYLLSYSIVRFLLEFIRTDSLYLFNLFPGAQVVSVVLIIVSVVMLTRLRCTIKSNEKN